MVLDSDIKRQEVLEFQPGLSVELKRRPGIFDTIADYDPMMVPPISLVNDPMPRYPEELRLIHSPISSVSQFNRRPLLPTRYPSCQLHNDLRPVGKH